MLRAAKDGMSEDGPLVENKNNGTKARLVDKFPVGVYMHSKS
jgi:hypothetical protein